MKTRIKIITDGNGRVHYQPQYKWFGFWLHFIVKYPLIDESIVSVGSEELAVQWIEDHLKKVEAAKQAAAIKRRAKKQVNVTYKNYS